jgi:hypothetical protein
MGISNTPSTIRRVIRRAISTVLRPAVHRRDNKYPSGTATNTDSTAESEQEIKLKLIEY